MDLQGTQASPSEQAEHNPPWLIFGDHNSLTSNSPPWLFCAGRIPPAPVTSSFVHQLVLQLFTWPSRTKQNRASSLLVVATFLLSSGHTPSRQPQHYAFKIHSSPRASLLEEQSTLERRSDFFPPSSASESHYCIPQILPEQRSLEAAYSHWLLPSTSTS